MLKKLTALALSLVFVFSLLGLSTILSGVISVGAVYYDYYNYTTLPGFTEFTEQDFKEIFLLGVEGSQVTPPSNAPARVDKATKFTVTNPNADQWPGRVTITSFVNMNSGQADQITFNLQWTAKKYPSSGATLCGGYDFSNASGFSFWIGRNNENEARSVKINIFAVPSQSVYYEGDDPVMTESTMGFVYEATKSPDADGYVYFDFKTDFSQVDWWWKDDDGNNHSVLNPGNENLKVPLPMNMRDKINGMSMTLLTDTVGDEFYIGDFCAYADTRVHIEQLSDAIDRFDALNPDAYTSETYGEATEVYFRAFEMLMTENIEEVFTQKDVDNMARELNNAINSLLPLFPVKDHSIEFNGFDSLSESDIDSINDGGVSIDFAIPAIGVGPDNCEFALEIFANGDPSYNEPYYGWSSFSTLVDKGNGPEAVGNVFGADLSGSAGLRFWLKNPVEGAPIAMQILVGKAGESEFIAEDFSIDRPMEAGEEGYVSVSWSSFFDFTDEGYDIYDYLDQLDYITIQFDDLRGVIYTVSDLHVFNWSMQNADLTEILSKLAETNSWVATLDEDDYLPRSWNNLMAALNRAEELTNEYGVTQKEIDDASALITKRANGLVPIGNGPTASQIAYLETLTHSAQVYWRGNYIPASYNALDVAIKDAIVALEEGMAKEAWDAHVKAINDATAALVPITHGGVIEDGFYSFEDFSSRDFSKTTGDRSSAVEYSLLNRKDASFLPEGYDKALKMTALYDYSSEITDEHGVLQYKTMYRNEAGSPVFITPSNGKPLVGDLTGSDGILLWVGVNDINLVDNALFRIGISNCHKTPLFEMHAIDIPLPATGSGWLYIPWNYFDHYDEWTNGEPIRLNDIGFYIFRFDGEVKQGLEVYITGVQAYTGTSSSTNSQPIIDNVTEGQVIDLSAGAFRPNWSAGSAFLKESADEYPSYFTYGDSIEYNGEYTMTVVNGDKSTTVSFSTVGGKDPSSFPIVGGVEDGGEYEDSVTLTWDTGLATLNGSPVANGTVVSEPGTYKLEVINGDKVTKVSFTIKGSSLPEYIPGDLDKDGIITVSDALAALRVAAKIAEETEEFVLIGDADADGKITVSDALAILRVAAKMADSIR